MPIETVSKMLGHTNIETTQIYARITNSKISNDMKGLTGKFAGVEKSTKKLIINSIWNLSQTVISSIFLHINS